jgi:hypothetical protein
MREGVTTNSRFQWQNHSLEGIIVLYVSNYSKRGEKLVEQAESKKPNLIYGELS